MGGVGGPGEGWGKGEGGCYKGVGRREEVEGRLEALGGEGGGWEG